MPPHGWVFTDDGSRMELSPEEVKAVNMMRLVDKLRRPGQQGKVVVTQDRTGKWRERYSVTE